MAAFKLAVLTDEISQDIGRALEVAAREFRLGWVELRAMHNKNIMRWDARDVGEVRRLLRRYGLRVTQIASPLFKVDWPGAPRSRFSLIGDQFGADFTYAQQDEVLERAIDLARAFETRHVRCFDFWRLDDQAPYRRDIDDRLRRAAERARRRGITLALENEHSCNTATGAEAARLLDAVRDPGLMLNWDPGNAAHAGEAAYPDGYARLPKDRLVHVHVKDLAPRRDGPGFEWARMGDGIIDYVGQFRALVRDGYRGPVSLETHWRGAGTAEESTRQSMARLKALLAKAGAL